MSIKVEELMTRSVITAQPHQSVEHVRSMLEKILLVLYPLSTAMVIRLVSCRRLTWSGS